MEDFIAVQTFQTEEKFLLTWSQDILTIPLYLTWSTQQQIITHCIEPVIFPLTWCDLLSDTESNSEVATVNWTQDCSRNQLLSHRTSGTRESSTLSSCGTNREALMPWCHHQYIPPVMMFPHKYFMLYEASKTHSGWMEEETCILSL